MNLINKALAERSTHLFEFVKAEVERTVSVAKAIELRKSCDDHLDAMSKDFASSNGVDFFEAYDQLTQPGEPGRPLLEASMGLSEIIADSAHPARFSAD